MATRNIEMNYFNGSGYDVLHPSVTMGNVGDWNNYVYSKSEVDGSIGSVNNSLNSNVSEINGKIDEININIEELNTFNQTKYKYNLIKSTKVEKSMSVGYGYERKAVDTTIVVPQNSFYYYQDIALVINGRMDLLLTNLDVWVYERLIVGEDKVVGLINYPGINNTFSTKTRMFENETVLKGFYFSGKSVEYSMAYPNPTQTISYFPSLTNNILENNFSSNGTNIQTLSLELLINCHASNPINPGETGSLHSNVTIDLYTRTNPWIDSVV